ncbi:MAG TPA: FtsQ-type POTRA domain-containing protein [Dehalococcoidia bacterium]
MADRKRRGSPFSAKARSKAVRGEVLLDDRTQRRLSRIRWRRIGAVLAFAGAIAGLVALYFSPAVRVQEIEVGGATTVSSADIEALAGLDGASLLTANLGAAESRIEELPIVKKATITRSWPQTVSVAIVERKPWAVWQAGGRDYTVDDEGVVLEADAPAGAPVIRVSGADVGLEPGQSVDQDAVGLARSLMERVPAELALNVATFEWSGASGLTITTDGGYGVVLGDSQDMDYKLAVWREIEAQLGRESMTGHVLDLRFGDRPSFQ